MNCEQDRCMPDTVNPFWPIAAWTRHWTWSTNSWTNLILPTSWSIIAVRQRGWDVHETDDTYLHEQHGLDKEGVKVLVEQNTLIVKGNRAHELHEEESMGVMLVGLICQRNPLDWSDQGWYWRGHRRERRGERKVLDVCCWVYVYIFHFDLFF